RYRGGQVHPTAILVINHDPASRIFIFAANERFIISTHSSLPVRGQGICGGSKNKSYCIVKSISTRGLEKRSDHAVTKPAGEVRPKCLPPSIGEILRVGQIPDGRYLSGQYSIPHPHGCLRIF